MRPQILRIGHRGAAGHAPENTLSAVRKAIELGADYTELDVRRSADDQLVIMHDKRVDRTTNGSGLVEMLSTETLRSLDAGSGERVPLLEEVLEVVDGRIGLMAEIVFPGIAYDLAGAIQHANVRTPVIYASFLHSELLAVREVVPDANTLALLEGIPISGARFALDAKASYVGLGFESVTEAFVRALHDEGITVFVYTVNSPADIQLARDLCVDGIVSDYPEVI
jgi:glycerophosphoryl diester phosphodiesterase